MNGSIPLGRKINIISLLFSSFIFEKLSAQLTWPVRQYLHRAGYLVQPDLCLLLTDKNSYTTHTGIRTIETDIEIEPGGMSSVIN